jgi:nicotinate-nucleotide pyrophosphorylase (carboxylating)
MGRDAVAALRFDDDEVDVTKFPTDAAYTAVSAALAEDAAADDLTTLWSVPANRVTQARIVARHSGVIAGLPVITEVFAQVDPDVAVTPTLSDGAMVGEGDVVAELSGPARSLITGERTALNFLQRMSGIATMTSSFVACVRDLPVRILDTRKTAPGLRQLDKYAVAIGGGTNHRMNLGAMVLLKENHLAAAGGVAAAVAAVRRGIESTGREVPIEVEVTSVAQAVEALGLAVAWIMLDNMSLAEMRHVVELRDAHPVGSTVRLEASGTVTLGELRAVAETGVDAISVGALTHSAAALDLSMLIAGA